MTWVFEQLGWLHKPDLWQVFRERSFYLVHAVKCWQVAKFSWDIPGLVETCPRNLLAKNIEELDPETLCALGKLPHKALRTIWPSEIPETISLGKGWCKSVKGRKVIVTTFPNWHWILHGSVTYGSKSKGWKSLQTGGSLIARLVPALVELVSKYGDRLPWDPAPYPRFGYPGHPWQSNFAIRR